MVLMAWFVVYLKQDVPQRAYIISPQVDTWQTQEVRTVGDVQKR